MASHHYGDRHVPPALLPASRRPSVVASLFLLPSDAQFHDPLSSLSRWLSCTRSKRIWLAMKSPEPIWVRLLCQKFSRQTIRLYRYSWYRQNMLATSSSRFFAWDSVRKPRLNQWNALWNELANNEMGIGDYLWIWMTWNENIHIREFPIGTSG